jgi:hypothetical protein
MHNALPLSLGKNTYKTNVEKFSSKLVTSTVMPVPAEGGTEPSEPGDSSQGGKSILCSQITAQHGVSCPLHSDQIFSIFPWSKAIPCGDTVRRPTAKSPSSSTGIFHFSQPTDDPMVNGGGRAARTGHGKTQMCNRNASIMNPIRRFLALYICSC